MHSKLALFALGAVLSGCIPFGSVVHTDNPRSGIWVTPNGYAWAWHVDQPAVVSAACGGGGQAGCVRWVPYERTGGEIWMVDSANMAAHECKHAIGFSWARTQEDVDAELNHVGESGMMFSTGGEARAKPCES